MLSEWENKFRQHWPHHYRDILDKINSPMGMVVVSDLQNEKYKQGEALAILQKSSKSPINYKIILQNPATNKAFEEQIFNESELDQAIESFLQIIGGWDSQKR